MAILVCVLNAGPHDFYGRWVVSLESGRSVEVSLNVPVGRVVGGVGVFGGALHAWRVAGVDFDDGGGSSYVLPGGCA